MFNLICIWQFINDNSGAFQAIFSLLIVIITIIYVVINSLMHSEMVKARKREEKPVISIRIKRVKAAIYSLIIENISNVPAYELEFTKVPDLKHSDDNDITTKKIGIIQHPIKYLAPKQVYESIFLNLNTLDKKFHHKRLEFEVKYKDIDKKDYDLAFEVDVSNLYNIKILLEK